MRERTLDTLENRTTLSADFKIGLRIGFPVMLGYFPIAVSFGVLAIQTGIPLFHATMMSLLVYAGASQFMALNMIALGTVGIEIIFATLVLNFRHFVMSFSLFSKMGKVSKRWMAILAHGITDEAFATASFKRKEHPERQSYAFYGGIFIGPFFMWVTGTLIGGLLGSVVPPALSASMGIALYALFIALLIPAVRSQWRVGVIAGIGGLFCAIFSLFLSEGWAIVLATVLAGFAGVFLIEEEE